MGLIFRVPIIIPNELPEHANIRQITHALADGMWRVIEDEGDHRIRVSVPGARRSMRARVDGLHHAWEYILGPRSPE